MAGISHATRPAGAATGGNRPDVAYNPELVAQQVREKWITEKNGHRGIAQNRFYNGEMWPKNSAGLPRKERFHKDHLPDEEWWLRNNDRRRACADLPYTFFDGDPLSKKHFNAGALPEDHGRRVFQELAHQRRHSEASLLAVQQDSNVRRAMAKRYGEVMRAPPAMLHASRSEMRSLSVGKSDNSSSSKAAGSASATASGTPVAPSRTTAPLRMPVAPRPSSAGLMVRNRHGATNHAAEQEDPEPQGKRGSQVSICAPPEVSRGAAGSQLSACAPPGSLVSACAPLASYVSASVPSHSLLSAARPAAGEGSAVAPSALSEATASDFYSWRPRLIM